MASKTITVGNGGKLTIHVDLVSQNRDNNTSRVRVRGIMQNNAGRSYDSSGVFRGVSGTNTYQSTFTFDLGDYESLTFIDVEFIVPHNANGTKTVSYAVTLGATLTGTFGSGGAVALDMVLPTLVKGTTPATPRAPTLRLEPPRGVFMAWNAPSNGGYPIDEYRVRIDDNPNFTSPEAASNGTSGSRWFYNLPLGRRQYFQVAAHNAAGWSLWSPASSILVPNTPDKVGLPTIALAPPDGAYLTWSAPDNRGATITGYDIQYDDRADFGSPLMVSTSNRAITLRGFSPARTIWARVRAKNSQGVGAWSNAVSILIASGPKVLQAGEWRNTITYVRFEGEWRIAVPYIRQDGVWKLIGG